MPLRMEERKRASRSSRQKAAFFTNCSASVPPWLAISESFDSCSGVKWTSMAACLIVRMALSILMCSRAGRKNDTGRPCAGQLAEAGVDEHQVRQADAGAGRVSGGVERGNVGAVSSQPSAIGKIGCPILKSRYLRF